MKKTKRLFSLLLCFTLLLSLAAPALAKESEGDAAVYSAVVRFAEDADANALCDALEAMPGISVRWQYTALFSGAAIEGTRAALQLAGEKPGVAALALSRTWTKTDIVVDPLDPTNSLDVMNGQNIPYDGDGMVVAVLDSALKLSHETFGDYGIIHDVRITRESVDAFKEAGGTDGRYVSVKIPYVYDYSGMDRAVSSMDNHGTHVSALAVGYSLREDGSVEFRGVAPAAQLLFMKVFPDDTDLGADDADILKAMEDAYLLGADVINLSLGMTNAYENDVWIGAIYSEVLAKLEMEGVVVCCAVGNEGISLAGKTGDTALPTTGYTDYAAASAPAIYEGATAIAAVNSVFYETGRGIIAGDRAIIYTDAVSDTEGYEPPDIGILAGRTLEYVVIGGLGKAEDFEGLDLTGCAALISRGEIYFSEKARNAAAAGAELCIIYNNEPGAILAAVEDIPIPCVVVTQEDGAYLIEQAQQGRGTLLIAPDRMRISTGEDVTMFSYSSWGSSPSLDLVPALSAPGGMILSAGIETNGAYVYLSGTSMAAPNASGAYAVVLQALLEQGIENRAERAALAGALLQSTAQILKDEDGVPLSPRRQGAGVIDLAAALETGAVIKDPLLEPGENDRGQFKLSFTVKNLTDEEKRFTVDTTVLTDDFAFAANAVRSTLTSMDISDSTTVVGKKQLTVAPMGETTVTLMLYLSPTEREALEKVYPNGFYTEGYVTLTDETGEKIHATFLGYCGDWEQAPIIEQVDFRAVMNAYYEQHMGDEDAMVNLAADMGYNYVLLCDAGMDTYGALLLGENPWLVTPASDSRIAMPIAGSDAIARGGDRFVIDLYTLRNAEHVIMVVSDQKTGEIYCADDRAYLTRSLISEALGSAASTARFVWNGTAFDGTALPGGTAVTVAFYAWLESEEEIAKAYKTNVEAMAKGDYSWLLRDDYDGYIEWSFPLVLDGQAPRVSCCVNEWQQTVEITVTDEHFVAYFAVQNEAGEYLAQQACEGELAGERYTVTLSLDGCGGDMLFITAADYAGNAIGYEIDLSGAAVPERCCVAMLTDVDKVAWYHEAVDFVLENGLMTIGDDLIFSPDAGALRVQVLELLYRLAGQPIIEPGTVTLPFNEVSTGASYRPALEWAYSLGIVTGYDDTMFGAYAPVQRAQLAVMLYRAAQAAGEDTDCGEFSFADAREIPEWALQAVGWAADRGYLTPDENGNINARAYITRAEFAYIVMKYYENK